MSRHQVVIEVDTGKLPDDGPHTIKRLMLALADLTELRGWILTDAYVREVPEDD